MDLLSSLVRHAANGVKAPRHAHNVARGVGLVLCSAASSMTGLCSAPSGAPSPGSSHSHPATSSSRSASSLHRMHALPKFSSSGGAVLRTPAEEAAHRRANIRFQAVPSSRVRRAANFAILFARLGWEKYKDRLPMRMGSWKLSFRSWIKYPHPTTITTSTTAKEGGDRNKVERSWACAADGDGRFPSTPTAATSTTSSPLSSSPNSSSARPPRQTFSNKSHERIVETLCRMRGAVLKLGQMLSIQDGATVPSHITALFAKVRDQAFAMPPSQLQSTLAKEFGDANWREKLFVRMEDAPVAAASIGQVHWGELKWEYSHAFPASSVNREATMPTGGTTGEDGRTGEVGIGRTSNDSNTRKGSVEVAIKVQYPGVAQSIDSDIKNLRTFLNMGFLPPGMFVDQVLRELRAELLQECQYLTEAEKQIKYATLVEAHPVLSKFFYVPRVFRSLCTSQLLVSEYVRGVPIDQITNPALQVPLEFRSYAAEQLMTLTLTELFDWCYMQTDPNFSNFLFNAEDNKVYLLDFGAARSYPTSFVQDYLEVVAAAARQDRETIVAKSIDLGFLTGREVKEMLDAHVESVLLLGKPFRDREKLYDFSLENIPSEVQKLVPTMLRLRLKPPPPPAYSLHRRLSGTILLCTRLSATVPCGKVFWELYDRKRAEFAAATSMRFAAAS